MVHPKAGIKTLKDLKGRKLGIAGGPVDKSWLMLRAYSKKKLGIDLKKVIKPTSVEIENHKKYLKMSLKKNFFS